ncbi:SGNH/GDSL hydrolase family protein [bacterium]|nr:SGNH/GDSL hydrolase family protein [bacterium]
MYFFAVQFLAIALIALLAEGGMRIYRHVIQAAYQKSVAAAIERSKADEISDEFTYKIIAIGDSHTYGVDSSPGKDYPRQLVDILAERRPDLNVELENLAHPGMNSVQAADALQNYISAVPGHPINLVLACVGNNNKHNLVGLSDALGTNIEGLSPSQKLAHLLKNSGAYRLTVLTRSRLEQRVEYDEHNQMWVGCVLCGNNEPLLGKWMEHDLRRIVELAQSRGALPVFLSYFWMQPYVDRSMSNVAEQTGAIYVPMVKFGLSFSSDDTGCVGPTYHPNDEGYGRIAATIYNALLHYDALPAPPENAAFKATSIELPPHCGVGWSPLAASR